MEKPTIRKPFQQPILCFVCFVASLLTTVETASSGEVEVFGEVAKLVASDGRPGDRFGRSVSLDGDRMVIGASGDEATTAGRAYISERDASGVWQRVTALTPDPGNVGDSFGVSVSLDGDRLVVGASGDSELASEAGAAYVFERDSDGEWLRVAKLLAPDAQDDAKFGYAVAIEGEWIVVGAVRGDHGPQGPGGLSGGAAYVFARGPDGSWSPVSRVDEPWLRFDNFLGSSASLSGDRMAIGALGDGSVHIYEPDPDSRWRRIETLRGDGDGFDGFGTSVSLEGDRLAAGEPGAGGRDGTVFIFERQADGEWLRIARFIQPDGDPLESFGHSISLSGDRVLVGTRPFPSDTDGGSVYLIERESDGNWRLVDKLTASDAADQDQFGTSISVSGDRIAVGANLDDDAGLDSGSAYVFDLVAVSPQLTVSGRCPGEIVVSAQGMTPRRRVELFGSDTTGANEVELGPCAGTELGLASPIPLLQIQAGFDAERSLVRTVSEPWCGSYLQLLDERTCLTSAVTLIPGGQPR